MQIAEDALAAYIWRFEPGITGIDRLRAFEEKDGRSRACYRDKLRSPLRQHSQ